MNDMNDQFLNTLRAQPSTEFAVRLKARLDAQDHAVARAKRRRYLAIAATVLFGSTALAVMSPPVRQFAASLFGVSATAPAPEQLNVAPPGRDLPVDQRRATEQSMSAHNEVQLSPGTGTATASADTVAPDTEVPTNRFVTKGAVPASAPAPAAGGAFGAFARPQIFLRASGPRAGTELVNIVLRQFKADEPGMVDVAFARSDNETALAQLCQSEVEIAPTTRPILANETAVCARYGVYYIELPVAHQALAIVRSPQSNRTSSYTVADLAAMWRREDSRNRWRRVVADGRSHTTAYFGEILLGGEAASGWWECCSEELDVSEILRDFRSEFSSDTLAVVGYPDYELHEHELKAVAIANSRGTAVLPSVTTIQNGSYDTLARPIFLYANARLAERTDVKRFMTFWLGGAGPLVTQANYVPLSPAAAKLAIQNFNSGKAGTVFGGKPLENGVNLEVMLGREARTY